MITRKDSGFMSDTQKRVAFSPTRCVKIRQSTGMICRLLKTSDLPQSMKIEG